MKFIITTSWHGKPRKHLVEISPVSDDYTHRLDDLRPHLDQLDDLNEIGVLLAGRQFIVLDQHVGEHFQPDAADNLDREASHG